MKDVEEHGIIRGGVEIAGRRLLYHYVHKLHPLLKTLDKLILDDAKLVGIDIETYAKKKYKDDKQGGLLAVKSKIRTIQIFNGKEIYILDFLALPDTLKNETTGEVREYPSHYFLQHDILAERLFKYLYKPTHKLVAHNAIFDQTHLQYLATQHKIRQIFNIYCTMNAYNLILHATDPHPPQKSSDLANVSKRVLGIKVDKEEQRSDWSKEELLSKKQVEYCARDAVLPWLLLKRLWKSLESAEMLQLYEINTKAQDAIATMNIHGLAIDKLAHEKLCTEWFEKRKKSGRECFLLLNEGKGGINEKQLKELCTAKVVTAYKEVIWQKCGFADKRPRLVDFYNARKRFFKKADDIAASNTKGSKELKGAARACARFAKNIDEYLVNPNSSKQLSDWLKRNTDTSEWPVSKKSGNLITSAETFADFKHLDIVAPLVEFKEFEKLYTTYGVKMRRFFVEKDDVTTVHPSFTLCYTETGRMSSREPNGQNSPKDEEFRSIFITRPGYKILNADYNQAEIRAFAYLSKDSIMCKAYERGIDIHGLTATSITGHTEKTCSNDEWKRYRQLAKSIVFCFLFGGGAATAQRYAKVNFGIIESLEFFQEIVNKFRKTYYEGREWQQEHCKECEKRLWVRTRLGKLRQLDSDNYYTCGLNTPVQGSAAEVVIIAAEKVDTALRTQKLDAALINVVHDELNVEAAIKHVKKASAIMKFGMEQAMLTVFPEATLNNLVDVGVGDNWWEAKL